MPWTANDAPRHTKKANTAAKKSKWAKIANSVLSDCLKAGGSQKTCEGKAVRIANSKLEEVNMGWTDEDIKRHNEYFGVTEELKKAGGSNVGKYPGVKTFCGPAGGAPKGTYPVNTKKRAIAALAYARHAPNPAGIKKCVCRHWPALPACKTKKRKKKMEETQTVPKGALCFRDENCFAKITGEKDQLDMVIYSGGIIKDHWWWNNLVIDLQGMSFPKKTYPILESHSTDKKIGFMNKPLVNGNLRVDSNKITFVDTEASQEFIRLSKEGFPYESSMYAKPTVIERVDEGATATSEVNGMTVKGPATIWRKSIFKEASVCVFGYDSNTKAAAFADDEVELNLETNCPSCKDTNNEEVNNMTLDELKEQHPELFGEITDSVREMVTTELTKKFNQEKKDLEDKNKAIEDKLSGQKKENESLSDKVLVIEKAEAIRSENDLKRDAKEVWVEKLTASDVPKDMYGKVSNQVSYRKFLKDGILDTEAFTKAVEVEISDWEKKGVTETVIGTGFSTKDVETEETKNLKLEEKKDDELADSLFDLSGAEKATEKEVK